MGLQKFRADQARPPQDDGAVVWVTNWIGGPTIALVRNCRCVDLEGNQVIPRRTVYATGDPDTCFSIPAACSYRGKTIRGAIMSRDGELYFVPMRSERERLTRGTP